MSAESLNEAIARRGVRISDATEFPVVDFNTWTRADVARKRRRDEAAVEREERKAKAPHRYHSGDSDG